MRLTHPPGFNPTFGKRDPPKQRLLGERFSIENAKEALANPAVRATSASLYTEAHVIGDHAGSAMSLMRSFWSHQWVGDSGWLKRSVGLIIAGNLWDGDHHVMPGDIRADEMMAWLAAHDSHQVQILIGAHDLERLGALGRAPDRWLCLARAAASAVLKLPTSAARRTLLQQWTQRRPHHPAPFAAYEHRGRLRSEARLLRRLLLASRAWLATTGRDLQDGRLMLISHSGITRSTIAELGVGNEAQNIARELNCRLYTAVQQVRADWENLGVLPLDLGDLYHPWGPLRPSSGPLAYRPAFEKVIPLNVNELGLDQPLGMRVVSATQFLVPGLTQIAGYTRRDRAGVSLPSAPPGHTASYFNNTASVIKEGKDGHAELQCQAAKDICEWPENSCFFTNWTMRATDALGGLWPLTVSSQNRCPAWSATVPDPTPLVPGTASGLITILAAGWDKRRLLIVEEFLADCINRLCLAERASYPFGSQLEGLHDWVNVLLKGSKNSPATRLGQRWLNTYLTARDGKPRPYPPVWSHSVEGA